jgi:hypothetical protein
MAWGKKQEVLRLGKRQSASLILSYLSRLLRPQFLSIGLVVVYLVLFQTLALGVPVSGALGIGAGVLLCALGLSAFLEGLFLGIMPLGSQCGMRLPGHSGPVLISLFAFVLGVGATLAEPAIGFLRAAGASIRAWDSPLLYAVLNRYPEFLTMAISVGVGAAAVLGIMRFVMRLPFKPLLFITALSALTVSAIVYFDPVLRPILGLAWDSGGITTGPVTVPLVLSLGIGMSRVLGGKNGSPTEGFGVVTFASLLPVIAVIALGAALAPGLPGRTSREAFFSPENRPQALHLFKAEADLDAYAKASLGAEEFASYAAAFPGAADGKANEAATGLLGNVLDNLLLSVKAILPLSLLLIAVLLLLREKIRQPDELILGLLLAIAGLFLFNLGMNSGLGKIGQQTGAMLPTSYSRVAQPEATVVLRNFDPGIVRPAIRPDGERVGLFTLYSGGSELTVEYDPKAYDPQSGEYTYVPVRGPIFGPGRTGWGILMLFLFAFFLGYGVTAAEPSLMALGMTVEDISAGTYRKSFLVSSTAVGVGVGLAAGFALILWKIPLMAVLIPVYLAILVLTLLSNDDFAALAWDTAGVTTGPVTVPLVIATGLGIGGQTGALDSFGILSCASAFPIAAVLLGGMRISRAQSAKARSKARQAGAA